MQLSKFYLVERNYSWTLESSLLVVKSSPISRQTIPFSPWFLILAAIVSVITMDRFTESSVNPEKAKHMDEWYKRPHRLIAELIQKTIQSCGDTAPFRGCHISEKYCHENQLIPIKVLLLADLQRRLDRTIEKVSRRTKTPEVEVPEKYRQFRPLTKDVHSEFFSKQET